MKMFKTGRARCATVALMGLLALRPVSAQPQHAYTHFTTNDGLAQNMVVASHLDSRGFLWFGTKSGLSRYNGYTFTNFQHEPSDSSSIYGGYIHTLHECPSGDLWIGFTDGNIDVFHRREERFEHLNTMAGFSTDNRPRFVTNIVEVKGGDHWYVVPGYGIMEVLSVKDSGNAAHHRYQYVLHEKIDRDSVRLDCLRPLVVFADRSGGLWIQGDSAFVILGRRLPPTVKFPRPMDIVPTAATWAWVMLEDVSGELWLNAPDVLVRFDPASGRTAKYGFASPNSGGGYTRFDRNGNIVTVNFNKITRINKNNPSRQEIIPLPPLHTGYQSVTFDSSDAVWLGTSGFGLYRYDGRAARFGLVSNTNWWDNLYKATREFGFPPRSDPSVSRSPQARVYWYNAKRDRRGGIWSKGIYNVTGYTRFDSRTGKIQNFPLMLRGWRESAEWFGGWGGLSLFGLEDVSGNFWLGNLALYKYEETTEVLRCFQLYADTVFEDSVFLGDKTATIVSTLQDRDGTFWLGTVSHGLYHFDPVTFSVRHFSTAATDTSSISHNHILSICNDPLEPEKYLWLGTDGGGLNRFEKKTGNALRFSQENGLPNNVVYAILPDKRNNLWMSTNRGLARMDPQTRIFRNYDLSDGLTVMEFNREEYYQDEDGKMYFGNIEGVNIFDPETIVDNPYAPPIVLTDFKIRNASVSVRDSKSVLTASISEAKEIELPYEQNVFTLEFAALDFANPWKNLYSHILEGFEKEWNPPSTIRTATYTNLDPGEYVFRVRGSNCDGVWNKTGTSLKIIILPPWYRSMWAYASYTLLALGGLFLFRRYDLKRIRLKDQLDLEQARSAQLREVDQLKMRFFQNVSHEFRTPLTLILGPVEKLLENLSDQSHKRELRVVRRNAQRLLGLINQILDISKLEGGRLKLKASQADIVPFVRGVVMAFHSLAERKGIFLDVQNDAPSLLVFFDRDKLEKVIVNLLGNSFKFTPESGEIIVNISSCGAEAIISVRDTGIGIPKEKLPHIFDRFYQVDGSTTRSAEGTGIGLSLVKDFVELHHGDIEVTSEPGHGTEFIVHLPLGAGHLTSEEFAAEPPPTSLSPAEIIDSDDEPNVSYPRELPDETSKPIILIVEDNADVRDYIRSCFDGTYAISEAHDGAEGIAAAASIIPDLVISDVMMPNMDGYELCTHLKRDEKTSHIPVILLTAKAALEDKIGGLETGADDYLIKPFEASELLVRVKNLIDLRRRLREKFGKELVTLKLDEVKVTPVEQLFLQKVMKVIESRLGDESFNVEELAANVAMSYTQLHRKLKAITNQSAAQFIRAMRLKRAMELLQDGGGAVSEIAYSVGFGSPAYFTKCFQEEFGKTPSDVRRKN